MLKGYKTYLTAAAVILGAAAAYLSGGETLQQALQVAIPAIMALPLRSAIKTDGANA